MVNTFLAVLLALSLAACASPGVHMGGRPFFDWQAVCEAHGILGAQECDAAWSSGRLEGAK